MLISAIKKQASVCCSISLNPYIWYFKLGIMEKEKEKGKQFYCQLLDQSLLLYTNIIFKVYEIQPVM